ncbi:hypothetical protein PRZ48_011184 [Zasmidium cellare]|uniref:L-type lectin-like domain-containing protein n=1 Tax=Zasmidium cellare TaxID=395010 RepID=A0ABR0EAP8_ZASCE|nr:hypothetical protein PRZ48_011184 [Zasmidium cellare]
MAPQIPQSLAWLLLTILASAQYTLDSLSFGQHGQISSNGQQIPGWHASSVNHEVQVLSNKVILTPPVPGNAKGALWSDSTASQAPWSAEVEFRASGQETGSGNLNIWYTKDQDKIGTDSVYNAEKFDGMVLVVDQYGGSGGKIRGFLNDGSQNFRGHSSLESLAFGHCDYSYRNLGRPSKLKVTNNNGLTVSIDDRTCFSSDKISLPAGYHFGLTASTGENPDSFEVLSFQVQAGLSGSSQQQNQQPIQQQGGQQQQVPQLQKMDAFPGAPEYVPDKDADSINSQSDQFTDLHNRVQSLQHNMANMFLELKTLSDKLDSKHTDLLFSVQNMKGSQESGLPPEVVGKIQKMSERLESMEKVVEIVKRDVEGKDYRQVLNELHTAVQGIHGGLTEHLPDRILDIMRRHSPQFGLFVIIVVGVQIGLAGGYVLYKRRRNSLPKKFL